MGAFYCNSVFPNYYFFKPFCLHRENWYIYAVKEVRDFSYENLNDPFSGIPALTANLLAWYVFKGICYI
jgi:hypothetical protein